MDARFAAELAGLDGLAQADLVRRGEATPAELVEATAIRIDALNPVLNAVIATMFEKATDAATRGALPDGPFRGVPLLLKDLTLQSAGDPFHEGMAFLKRLEWRATADSYAVVNFREAGFLICGKTNVPELGIQLTTEPVAYGPTHNPWDLSRSPGGSSGGSAAAVAAGIVPIADGTDGAGSIRVPAGFCGLVGLKPSRGRVSLGPESASDVGHGFECSHVLTRSVRDSAAVLDVLRGNRSGDWWIAPPVSRPCADEVDAEPGRLRIGVTTSFPGDRGSVHTDAIAAVEDAVHLLDALGHHLDESHPAALDDPGIDEHLVALHASRTAYVVDRWSRLTGTEITAEDVEPFTSLIIEMGRAVPATSHLVAVEWMQRQTRTCAQWWDDGFDLLLTPGSAAEAPRLGEINTFRESPLEIAINLAAIGPFCPLFNFTGQPAISVPLHTSAAGLPVGVQLVAAYGREDLLLRVAAQLENARPWADRRPAVHANSVA